MNVEEKEYFTLQIDTTRRIVEAARDICPDELDSNELVTCLWLAMQQLSSAYTPTTINRYPSPNSASK